MKEEEDNIRTGFFINTIGATTNFTLSYSNEFVSEMTKYSY